jgi:AcrR family transcriptional regulator
MADVEHRERPTRRRHDPDARREAILAAAEKAFSRTPYGEVAVATVAAAAGASEALVYRYFGTKEHLYAELVSAGLARFAAHEAAALAALPEGTSSRDQVRTAVDVYLDHVARYPDVWAAPVLGDRAEPAAAAELRRLARKDYVTRLRTLLAPSSTLRHEHALWGFVGFLDATCLPWVERGCPDEERWAVVESALGALEGALGDWAA